MRKHLFSIALAMSVTAVCARDIRPFEIKHGESVTVSLPNRYRPVLASAVEILDRDIANVFGDSLELIAEGAKIAIDIDSAEVRKPQGFKMYVGNDGCLNIIGHDSHGASYGVMELSRLIGVSPWEWWADATPAQKSEFRLSPDFTIERVPTVEYREIGRAHV